MIYCVLNNIRFKIFLKEHIMIIFMVALFYGGVLVHAPNPQPETVSTSSTDQISLATYIQLI